jgi:hypothetical protein
LLTARLEEGATLSPNDGVEDEDSDSDALGGGSKDEEGGKFEEVGIDGCMMVGEGSVVGS